jgi:hypothetical protein
VWSNPAHATCCLQAPDVGMGQQKMSMCMQTARIARGQASRASPQAPIPRYTTYFFCLAGCILVTLT